MASESRDQGSVTVSLPPELEQWLDRQAAELDADRETVLLDLLSSYRAATDADDRPAAELLSKSDVEPLVRDVLNERLPDLTDAVAEQVAADVREELEPERETDLEARIERLEADYQDKLDDVRQRVIQIKRDADGKADAEHSHEELATATERLADLESTIEDHGERLSALDARDEESLDDIREDLDDAQEKLKTVAWVVRDLREAVQGGGAAAETLDHIKQRAAAEDVTRASCENCGSGVEIGLLTEPSCPHCDATLADVEPSRRRFGFGSATLTVAAGLESGADHRDELDDISTARGGDPQ